MCSLNSDVSSRNEQATCCSLGPFIVVFPRGERRSLDLHCSYHDRLWRSTDSAILTLHVSNLESGQLKLHCVWASQLLSTMLTSTTVFSC